MERGREGKREKESARGRSKEKENRRKKEKNEAVDPVVVVAKFGWTSHGIYGQIRCIAGENSRIQNKQRICIKCITYLYYLGILIYFVSLYSVLWTLFN